nr:type VI secretion system tube protein Hcp [uncultured Moellerella sp.]
MASIYMQIAGVDVKGGATVVGLEGDNWFAIESYNWAAARNVAMDIGNGNNADSGMVSIQPISIAKQIDGASEDLLSYLFNPGKDGKTIKIAFTKPEADGSGAKVYFKIELSKARLISYSIGGYEGGQPHEMITLSYVEIHQRHSYELEGGELKEGGIVTYNVSQGKLLSGSK